MSGKPFPPVRSDEEAEGFLEEADMSEHDWSRVKRMRIVFHDEQG